MKIKIDEIWANGWILFTNIFRMKIGIEKKKIPDFARKQYVVEEKTMNG